MIGPCARTLDLSLLPVVKSVFFHPFVSGGMFFGVFSSPFPEEEISDYIAHGPIIRVFTVVGRDKPQARTAVLRVGNIVTGLWERNLY